MFLKNIPVFNVNINKKSSPNYFFYNVFKYILTAVVIIFVIMGSKKMIEHHNVINTEYIEDNSAVVVDSSYMVRLTSKIKLKTKYGDTTVTSDYYYEHYKDKIGSKVNAKLEKTTYDNGRTDIEVIGITPLEGVN